MNLYIHINYPNIGPSKAFELWWSVFVLENLGKLKLQANFHRSKFLDLGFDFVSNKTKYFRLRWYVIV